MASFVGPTLVVFVEVMTSSDDTNDNERKMGNSNIMKTRRPAVVSNEDGW